MRRPRRSFLKSILGTGVEDCWLSHCRREERKVPPYGRRRVVHAPVVLKDAAVGQPDGTSVSDDISGLTILSTASLRSSTRNSPSSCCDAGSKLPNYSWTREAFALENFFVTLLNKPSKTGPSPIGGAACSSNKRATNQLWFTITDEPMAKIVHNRSIR